MNLTSTVFWKECSRELPKDDTTVIIFNKTWKVPVDLGYLREDKDWSTDEGLVLDNIGDCISPTHWAFLPDGPEL